VAQPEDYRNDRPSRLRRDDQRGDRITDPWSLAEIEDWMRNIIFHSTLDWQTREQLKRAARTAASDLACWALTGIFGDPS